jgi:hypothetical protein
MLGIFAFVCISADIASMGLYVYSQLTESPGQEGASRVPLHPSRTQPAIIHAQYRIYLSQRNLASPQHGAVLGLQCVECLYRCLHLFRLLDCLGDLFAHTASACESAWPCLASSIAVMAYVSDVPG